MGGFITEQKLKQFFQDTKNLDSLSDSAITKYHYIYWNESGNKF